MPRQNYTSKNPNSLQKNIGTAAMALMLLIGSATSLRVRRDISQPSYADKIVVWEVGSGALLTSNTDSRGWLNTDGQLSLSGSLIIGGSGTTVNGVNYYWPSNDGTASGKVLKTDGSGQLSWSADTDTDSDTTYIAGQGITLTGIAFGLNDARTGSTLDLTGNLTTDANLEINEDNGAADAVFTFGSDGSDETLTFINTEDTLEWSDDFQVTGNLGASGGLIVVEGAEGADGAIYIQADNGDDGTDLWKIISQQSGNDLSIENNATEVFNLTTAGAAQIDSNLTIGANGAVDHTITFDADTNDGVLTWMEDENRHEFSDSLHVVSNLSTSGSLSMESGASLNVPYSIPFVIALHGTDVTVGSGYSLPITPAMSGHILVGVEAWVGRAGTTNSTTLQIKNDTKRTHMLTTVVEIETGEIYSIDGTSPLIDTGNDDVSGRDTLNIYVESVSTTAPKGLFGFFYFVPQ